MVNNNRRKRPKLESVKSQLGRDRFVHISLATFNGRRLLAALDRSGIVWMYSFSDRRWTNLSTARLTIRSS
jgi:hypothetical protein